MRESVLLVAVVVVLIILTTSAFYAISNDVRQNSSLSQCDGSIWTHVHAPSRLEVISLCITASGVVENVLNEPDGDLHLLLRLDSQYSNLTNSANNLYQHGYLVVEIICVSVPTQADSVSACLNYTNKIPIPKTNQHITVTGPYVLDSEHYYWAEIHPVYSLKIS